MAQAARTRRRPAFRDYQVLLDDPAAKPSGGFDAYARALADIVLESPPRFAIGIFGSWGSGKTTLMQAIGRELETHSEVVMVDFNAWRYEREEHLIIPLLDTLRESLAAWAALPANAAEEPVARRAAAAVGRAARALILGLKLSARIPFIAEASVDLARVAEGFDDRAADEPASFYHTSFRALRQAIAEFVAEERRIVVFIDDLDRCLPGSALEVLESMKLFFDLPGFVFVVGLDQAVIERSIEFKYRQDARQVFVVLQTTENGGGSPEVEARPDANSPISGGEYIKKIFQVPFSLPPIAGADLETFFDDVIENSTLPEYQKDDLRGAVVQHLDYLSPDDTVNPREIKRFVNAYTIQLKMLAPKLGRRLNPDVVLALLTTNFRADWERMYGLLVADPNAFVEAVVSVGPEGAWIDDEPIPPSLLAYLDGPGSPLRDADLKPYITSVEATQTSDRSLQTAQSHLSRLRRLVTSVGEAPPDAAKVSAMHEELERLRSVLGTRSGSRLASNGLAHLDAVQLLVKDLPDLEGDRTSWADAARRRLDQVREILVALRRQASVGGRDKT